MELGQNIAKLRKIKKLTASELAGRIGIKQPYLSQLEKGRRYPSLEILLKIAGELNVCVSDLLGETVNGLTADMFRLVENAKELSSEQVDAVIMVVRELGSRYRSRE